jgi:hypothetical protein
MHAYGTVLSYTSVTGTRLKPVFAGPGSKVFIYNAVNLSHNFVNILAFEEGKDPKPQRVPLGQS